MPMLIGRPLGARIRQAPEWGSPVTWAHLICSFTGTRLSGVTRGGSLVGASLCKEGAKLVSGWLQGHFGAGQDPA